MSDGFDTAGELPPEEPPPELGDGDPAGGGSEVGAFDPTPPPGYLLAKVKGLLPGYTVRTALGGPSPVTADALGVASVQLPTGAEEDLTVWSTTGDPAGTVHAVAGATVVYATLMADWMYSRLPDMLRARDEVAGSPLRQLVRVLGFGMQDVRDLADTAVDFIDVDTCPADQLPLLGNLLGFEFPYDLAEDMQRNFVRSIVSMYRIKGTPLALKFVVNRLIAGKGFKLDIVNEDVVGKTFDLSLTAEDGAESSDALQSKITYLVGLYSPAGMVPRVVVVYYYDEQVDSTRRSDATHTTVEYTRWGFNLAGHTFNTRKSSGSVVSFNNLGQQTLSI